MIDKELAGVLLLVVLEIGAMIGLAIAIWMDKGNKK